ncbi:DNA polymerase IV [Williamsia deligens]|uniref:DNA polymerase IV n=1 Tax=Williamsia deligens TaxID=321325 RepID=A0ABW3G4F8_9NOCA|nr:DNA polymerase IV [Williamsia deligens]MCP2193733.1 DNA polymerase-4 [Williamsia deligens]
MRATASILHADLDSFYASVEQRDDPSLRGRPVIVGGGVVLAASYEAKAFGIYTPMGGSAARRLCPDVVVVPPRFAAYTQASRDVFAIFADTTPLVEGISVDEAFLDVSGLRRIRGSPMDIGRDLRARVAREVGLPITVGIARTKFLAKVASAVAKPDGLIEVPPHGEITFLHPLPIERLWGVGKVTAAKLHAHGITTVGDIADAGEKALASMVGRGAAAHLHALSLAQDPRRVTTGVRHRSIGAQRAMGRGPHAFADLDATVMAIADKLGRRLRRADRVCRTVVLRLRFDDFTRASRSHTLVDATDSTELILAAARRLLADAGPLIAERGCTLVGVALTNLADADPYQLSLPFREQEKGSSAQVSGGRIAMDTGALDATLDDLRSRFGSSSVTRGTLVGRADHDETPLLPD